MCNTGYSGDGFNCTSMSIFFSAECDLNITFQISMSVHWQLMTVTSMPHVLTLREASTVPATLALREMESTAQVINF